MKLWIDDTRPAPYGWLWAKTSAEAIDIFNRFKHQINVVSFDHDLGGLDTTRPVITYLCEWDLHRPQDNIWPEVCMVHSSNPVGVEWLRDIIDRYGPGVVD